MQIDAGLVVFGLVFSFNCGVLYMQVSGLRKDLNAEVARNIKMRHDDIQRIVEHIDRLKTLILKVIPPDQWPSGV